MVDSSIVPYTINRACLLLPVLSLYCLSVNGSDGEKEGWNEIVFGNVTPRHKIMSDGAF